MMRLLPVFLNCINQSWMVHWLIYLTSLVWKGCFQASWKLCCLYKVDDDMLLNNYRPVSLSFVLSKVFQRIMYHQLISFLENNKILFKNVLGFRKQHSTYMENGKFVVGIYLDFSLLMIIA